MESVSKPSPGQPRPCAQIQQADRCEASWGLAGAWALAAEALACAQTALSRYLPNRASSVHPLSPEELAAANVLP